MGEDGKREGKGLRVETMTRRVRKEEIRVKGGQMEM